MLSSHNGVIMISSDVLHSVPVVSNSVVVRFSVVKTSQQL